jgi:hypothetical protein
MGRRVIDRIDTGHELLAAELANDRVKQLEHFRRRKVEPGVRADRRAQLAHQARRVHSSAGHVTDHQSRPSCPSGIASYQSPPTRVPSTPAW